MSAVTDLDSVCLDCRFWQMASSLRSTKFVVANGALRTLPRPVVGSNPRVLNHRAVGGHEVFASALPAAEAAHSDIDCVSSAPEKVRRPARPERACGVATGFFPAARSASVKRSG
jgi:hypothetical protein